MTTLEMRYRDFRNRRLNIKVANIIPEHSEKMDAVENGLRLKVLQQRYIEAMDGQHAFLRAIRNAQIGRLFTAKELRNPDTMKSYIERGANVAKKLKI